jgi:hypothetical protein
VSNVKLYGTCRDCGWPIVDAICGNSEVGWGDGTWDYWAYCSNKTCEHHDGKGYEQEDPEWLVLPNTDKTDGI